MLELLRQMNVYWQTVIVAIKVSYLKNAVGRQFNVFHVRISVALKYEILNYRLSPGDGFRNGKSPELQSKLRGR